MTRCFGPNICRDFDKATSREWLETNGLGGYASSSLALCNTRRYHGLLVAATEPPVVRKVVLAKLDVRVCQQDATWELSTNKWPGAVHPSGHQLISSFANEPWPTWVYAAPGWRLQQEILMPDGLNATVARWTLLQSPAPLRLEIRPKVTSRDFHSLARKGDLGKPTVRPYKRGFQVTWLDGRPGVEIIHEGAFCPEPDFYYNYVYDREWERGFDCEEDLFQPGIIEFTLAPGSAASLVAAAGHTPDASPQDIIAAEQAHRQSQVFPMLGSDEEAIELARATRHYLVRRGAGWTVIAGYPWFGDWGRDTFIALPGLTLVTGRHQVARAILTAFAPYLSEGMMPNRFPDSGQPPIYNTVDAALWYIYALGKYLDYTHEDALGRELFPVVREILDRYERGTRYGIRLDHDGLLLAGIPGTQLTWMDAKIADWVVTPRIGKAVEIQALWHHALQVGRRLARALAYEDAARHYETLTSRAEASFAPTFWNHGAGCCHDVVAPDGTPDTSIRPNQLLVLMLAGCLLPPSRQRRLLDTVSSALLTPMGLRTLAPDDPQYVPRYQGDPRSRDAAYHQGTVWPWLIGPFISAYMNVHTPTDEVRRRGRSLLDSLWDHLDQAGIGHISELADGNRPWIPRGCIAQAWSVAEPLRVLHEHLRVEPSSCRPASTRV
ncbi:MAG: glycogen debranching enzyme family protein [Phycisphaerales bacterium]|nr:MAG: glycogen debranching enzyme family protein [Phycisphaerales bacterium]